MEAYLGVPSRSGRNNTPHSTQLYLEDNICNNLNICKKRLGVIVLTLSVQSLASHLQEVCIDFDMDHTYYYPGSTESSAPQNPIARNLKARFLLLSKPDMTKVVGKVQFR